MRSGSTITAISSVSLNNSSGFYLPSASSTSFATIFQPTGTSADVVNAQGINDKGLIVGFYLGNDGQAHGFDAKTANISNGSLVGAAITDPTIPNIPGEPGATFVFSQILGVNDDGIAVGYYGDSTGSQHGFLYNTSTGLYTFLDDPAAAFPTASRSRKSPGSRTRARSPAFTRTPGASRIASRLTQQLWPCLSPRLG